MIHSGEIPEFREMIISGFHKDANPTPLLTWLSSFGSKSDIVYGSRSHGFPLLNYGGASVPSDLCTFVFLGFVGQADLLQPYCVHLPFRPFSRHRFRLVTTSALKFISKLLIYYSARLSYLNPWCQSIYLILLTDPSGSSIGWEAALGQRK